MLSGTRLRTLTPPAAFANDSLGWHLRRRLQRAPGPDRLATLSRRRRIAKGVACVTAAAGFFSLYVLSWIVVLEW
jgi:hypothetical protein